MPAPWCLHIAITFLSKHNNATDRHALVSFKSMISSDPRGLLASWNDSVHSCRWPSVTCCGDHQHRVISLNLSSFELDGPISPAIDNLTFLKKIDLSNYQIHGSIPQEIGSLLRLQHLNLSVNSLEGGIPSTLSHRCKTFPCMITCSKVKFIGSQQLLRSSTSVIGQQ